MCAVCMLGACRGQKRTSDPLELDLGNVVSTHVGAGNQIQVLCTEASALDLWISRIFLWSEKKTKYVEMPQ